jgi:hypothetical protein
VTKPSEHAVDDEVAVVWMAVSTYRWGRLMSTEPLPVSLRCHKRTGFTKHFDDMPGLMMDTRADRDVLVPI